VVVVLVVAGALLVALATLHAGFGALPQLEQRCYRALQPGAACFFVTPREDRSKSIACQNHDQAVSPDQTQLVLNLPPDLTSSTYGRDNKWMSCSFPTLAFANQDSAVG
jgi:hypothetical protein